MHAPPRLLQRSAPLIAGLAIVLALMPPRPVGAGSPLLVPTAAITRVLGFGLAGPVVYVSSSSGLYRSASADYSRWTRQNTWPDIKLISFDPQHPDTLVFATGGDLYRSTDGGVTATKVKACGPTDIARSTHAPSIIYASAAAYRCGLPSILKSTDDGLTWTTVYTRPVDYESYEAFNHVAVDPANDSHVVAAKIDYHGYGELYESWDSGTTWSSTVHSGPIDYTPINALAINPPSTRWPCGLGIEATGRGGAERDAHDANAIAARPPTAVPMGALVGGGKEAGPAAAGRSTLIAAGHVHVVAVGCDERGGQVALAQGWVG
jgi:hypothetical protein